MNYSKRAFIRQSAVLGLAATSPLPLLAGVNTTLERTVNATVKQMRREGLITADERTAWAVTDIRRNQKLVSINENVPLQAASMIKHIVIQAYLMTHHTKSASIYPLDSRIKNEMRAMIVNSNNEFTNHIMKRLGGPQGVQWMLKKQAPNIFRNISIVEYIPAGGRTYRNRVSAGDYDRFLLALWRNQLPGAAFLKGLMRIKNHDRISIKTKHIPKTAIVYDKTGSTAMLCGNTGIIELRDKRGASTPYTITAIIEKRRRADDYTSWISNRSNAIRAVSDVIYLHFAHAYGLS